MVDLKVVQMVDLMVDLKVDQMVDLMVGYLAVQ
jgi:hypothetical protein